MFQSYQSFVFLLMLLVSAVVQAQIQIQAENADQIIAPFRVFRNATASGGKVVIKPSGSRGRGVLTFKLKIAETGDYELKSRVYAANTKSNSFLIRINGGEKKLWTLSVADVWQIASYPQKLRLQKGNQVLQIYSDKPDTGLDRIEILKAGAIVATPAPVPAPQPSPTSAPSPQPQTEPQVSLKRGLWVWTTSQVISTSAEMDRLTQACIDSKITDVYFYLTLNDYSSKAEQLKRMNARLQSHGIRSWGLEGYRGYFSDSYGPQGLYNVVKALIAFNSSALSNEKFYGFHSDMEPQDGQGAEFPASFHNGLADSKLNSLGGGVWYRSQVEDREMLLRDWLQINARLKSMTSASGLKLGAAMPSWTDDYFGEEVLVTYNGVRQGVMKHMMLILDEYAIMSYNTDPDNLINRVRGEMQYADTLPAEVRPKVFAGVETHKGVGAKVSYGDHAIKDSRSAVLADLEYIKSVLSGYKSFSGTNIHDLEGWYGLRP